jgi:uncharacterized DUF497 family protein
LYVLGDGLNRKVAFEWDLKKNNENLIKHGVAFEFAQNAFFDLKRIIAIDLDHSTEKKNAIFVLVMSEMEF